MRTPNESNLACELANKAQAGGQSLRYGLTPSPVVAGATDPTQRSTVAWGHLNRMICNLCGYCMDEGDAFEYYEEDTGWRGAKCPDCDVADDFEDIDAQWAVDTLRWYAKKSSQWNSDSKLSVREARIQSRTLAEISDMIDGEIE